MLKPEPARILRVHISESDRYQGEPLFEAVIGKCRELRIAGATVFRGLEGFGETADLHRAHLVRHDQPVVIVIVDTAQNLDRLVQAVEEMIDTGVLATSDVEMIRVQKLPAP
jgi:PII-like signaling protein